MIFNDPDFGLFMKIKPCRVDIAVGHVRSRISFLNWQAGEPNPASASFHTFPPPLTPSYSTPNKSFASKAFYLDKDFLQTF